MESNTFYDIYLEELKNLPQGTPEEEAALLTPQAEAIRIHKEDIPEHEETPAEPAENPVRPKITAPEPPKGNSLAEDQIRKYSGRLESPTARRIPDPSFKSVTEGKGSYGRFFQRIKRDCHALAADTEYFRCEGNDHRYQSGP